MKKRVFAMLTAFVMMFALLSVGAFADGITTLKFHYDRPDGDYTDWDMWIWGDGLPENTAYAFADEGGEKVVTVEVPDGTTSVNFIVRKSDWSEKDIDADQTVDLTSGFDGKTKDGVAKVKIDAGVEGYTVVDLNAAADPAESTDESAESTDESAESTDESAESTDESAESTATPSTPANPDSGVPFAAVSVLLATGAAAAVVMSKKK